MCDECFQHLSAMWHWIEFKRCKTSKLPISSDQTIDTARAVLTFRFGHKLGPKLLAAQQSKHGVFSWALGGLDWMQTNAIRDKALPPSPLLGHPLGSASTH